MTIMLSLQAREKGTSILADIRKNNQVPGVIYGNGEEGVNFSVDYIALEKVMRQGCFFNTVIEVELDGKKYLVLPKAAQSHPVTDRVLHIEMQEVTNDHRVDVIIPLFVVGVENSETLKRGGAVRKAIKGLKVRCKAGMIPKAVQLDVSNLKIGSLIKVQNLSMPEGIQSLYPADLTVLKIAGRNKDKAALAAGEEASAAE